MKNKILIIGNRENEKIRHAIRYFNKNEIEFVFVHQDVKEPKNNCSCNQADPGTIGHCGVELPRYQPSMDVAFIVPETLIPNELPIQDARVYLADNKPKCSETLEFKRIIVPKLKSTIDLPKSKSKFHS